MDGTPGDDPQETEPSAAATDPSADDADAGPRATQLQSRVRATGATMAVTATIAYAVLAVWTFRSFSNEISGIVLSFAWLVFGVVNLIALCCVWRGPTLVALTAHVSAAVINVMVLTYALLYDLSRSPEVDFFKLAIVGVALVLLARQIYVLGPPWLHLAPRIEVRTVFALVPVVAVIGAWNTYVFEPHAARPLVTVDVTLTPFEVVRSVEGQPDHLMAMGSVEFENIGDQDAGIVSSMYKATLNATPRNERSGETGHDGKNIAEVLNSTGALDPVRTPVTRLPGLLPTAESDVSIIAAGTVTPAYFFLAPGETVQRDVVIDVPIRYAASLATVSLQADVITVSRVLSEFHTCDAPADELTQQAYPEFVKNEAPGGGYFSCIESELPPRTPISALFGDSPGIRSYVFVGNSEAPDSYSILMTPDYSFDGELGHDNDDFNEAARIIDKYAPSTTNTATTVREVAILTPP
jgi:hypothetical protein